MLFFIAGVNIQLRPSIRNIAATIGSLLIATNVILVAHNWRAYNIEMAEFRSAYSQVARGSTVFSVRPDADLGVLFRSEPKRHLYLNSLLTLHQLQVLMLAERESFASYYFTHPQKQILSVRPEFQALDYTDGGVSTPWSMAMMAMKDPVAARSFLSDDIWAPTKDWWRRNDYLAVLYPSYIVELPRLSEDRFTPVFKGHWIAIFKIHNQQPIGQR